MAPRRPSTERSLRGAPQVINASEAPKVFRSPYMFARKVDPSVEPGTVRAAARRGVG